MGRKCFISFKTEDMDYKKYIQDNLNVDMIDKSLNKKIDSEDIDYIMKKIREEHLADSTVTIHLIGIKSSENLGKEEQKYIKRELQASLYNGENNTRNGILGIVLPLMYEKVYRGSSECSICEKKHKINTVSINDESTVKEFSYNYYIPNDNCCHGDEDRYCILVKWEDFIKKPEAYIEKAFDKRKSKISEKIKVYPK